MPKVTKRKYEKIDDSEIDLVIQCNDSHEFYERYRQAFPNRKKGIDSISKIWKRRSEFVKKHQEMTQPAETISNPSSQNFEVLISEQNKVLAELSGVMKEHLRVSKEILARLPKQIQKTEESVPKYGDVKIPEMKEHEKKTSTEKRKDIMIGS